VYVSLLHPFLRLTDAGLRHLPAIPPFRSSAIFMCMTYLRLWTQKFAVPPCVDCCVTYRTVEYVGPDPATNVISIEFLYLNSLVFISVSILSSKNGILYCPLLLLYCFMIFLLVLDLPTFLVAYLPLLSLLNILPTAELNLYSFLTPDSPFHCISLIISPEYIMYSQWNYILHSTFEFFLPSDANKIHFTPVLF
jgi:hypothetical protein